MIDAPVLNDAPRPAPSKTKLRHSASYYKCCDYQAKIDVDLLKDDLDSEARARLVRAWDTLEERKRILKMRPKPADMPVDPAALLKALKRAKVRAGGAGAMKRILGPIIEADAGDEPTPPVKPG